MVHVVWRAKAEHIWWRSCMVSWWGLNWVDSRFWQMFTDLFLRATSSRVCESMTNVCLYDYFVYLFLSLMWFLVLVPVLDVFPPLWLLIASSSALNSVEKCCTVVTYRLPSPLFSVWHTIPKDARQRVQFYRMPWLTMSQAHILYLNKSVKLVGIKRESQRSRVSEVKMYRGFTNLKKKCNFKNCQTLSE